MKETAQKADPEGEFKAIKTVGAIVRERVVLLSINYWD